MRARTLLSPAKLNLSLRLLGRRDDGYHLIDSIFAPVCLFDRLEIRFDATGGDHLAVESDSAEAAGGDSNLVFRAAAMMRAETELPFSLAVSLFKRIPVGSGLGGGSSNAATILRFLNQALGFPFNRGRLAEIGSRIGADVPFFIACEPALVRGVGDVVEPLAALPQIDVVIGFPGTHLSTAAVYAAVDRLNASKGLDSLTTTCPESNIADFVEGQRPLAELLVNDLEEAAAQICPDVLRLKRELLRLGALGASMTGSGSAVFGVCSDPRSAERIAAGLREKGWWAFSTKTLEAS